MTEGCYDNMFSGCKGIEKAPELPAPKLEKGCYQEMFYDCAKLNHVKCLATDIKAENSTKDWLGKAGTEATSKPVLESVVDMKAGSDDGVPTSWTAQKIVLVESVTLGKTELELIIGQADVTLTATVKPDDATDKTVTWTSSNPAVATVDETGKVHAVAAGEATITAQAGDKTAECKVTVKAATAAKTLAEVTADDIGKIVGQDGNIYADDEAASAADVTAVAMIAYVGSSTGVAGYTHGLALALTDEGQMNWSTAGTTCSGKNTSTPITGAKWLLASKDQWNYMITAAGSYTALRDGFTSVGGSNLQSAGYWSSSEFNSDNAWSYRFNSGSWYNDDKGSGDARVRACLAF